PLPAIKPSFCFIGDTVREESSIHKLQHAVLCSRLLDHSSLGRLDEADQQCYVFPLITFRLELLESLARVQFRRQQDLAGVVNFAEAFFAEAAALQADAVHAVSVRAALGGGLRKWQNVLRDGGAASDKGVRPNAHEMVHGTERADLRPVFDDNVSAERG